MCDLKDKLRSKVTPRFLTAKRCSESNTSIVNAANTEENAGIGIGEYGTDPKPRQRDRAMADSTNCYILEINSSSLL